MPPTSLSSPPLLHREASAHPRPSPRQLLRDYPVDCPSDHPTPSSPSSRPKHSSRPRVLLPILHRHRRYMSISGMLYDCDLLSTRRLCDSPDRIHASGDAMNDYLYEVAKRLVAVDTGSAKSGRHALEYIAGAVSARASKTTIQPIELSG